MERRLFWVEYQKMLTKTNLDAIHFVPLGWEVIVKYIQIYNLRT